MTTADETVPTVSADLAAPGAPAATIPAAFAEPTVKVGFGWTLAMFVANLGIWMGFFTPLQLLLHQQSESVSAQGSTVLFWTVNDPANRAAVIFSIISGIGALAACVANPLAGLLSDRTTGRLGRRRPWALIGAVLGAGGLVLLSMQHSVVGLSLCWVGVQICLNAMLAAITAAVPDRVPVSQRALISGWMGVPQVLGVVAGLELAARFSTVQGGYVAVAAAVVVLSLGFVFFTKEDALSIQDRQPVDWRGFWVSPRKHPDFAWAFGTRFLVQLGNSLGTLYLYRFLRDAVNFTEVDAKSGESTLVTIYGVGILLTTVIAGRISDRSGKRKGHVIVSGIVMAVAAGILAFWPTWTGAMVAAGVMGAGYGIYVAVDQALITQVLPSAHGRAKDLGIINIANSLPQVAVPVIAAPVLATAAGFPVLYAITAVVTLLGGVFVYRIRSVA
jgi:MFS family permease